jgi:hypothetical protein
MSSDDNPPMLRSVKSEFPLLRRASDLRKRGGESLSYKRLEFTNQESFHCRAQHVSVLRLTGLLNDIVSANIT